MVRQGSYSLRRPVVQTKNGEIVNEWESVAECARFFNVHNESMDRYIRGRQRTVGGMSPELMYREELNSTAEI